MNETIMKKFCDILNSYSFDFLCDVMKSDMYSDVS